MIKNNIQDNLSVTFVTRRDELLSKIECHGRGFHLETVNIKLRLFTQGTQMNLSPSCLLLVVLVLLVDL